LLILTFQYLLCSSAAAIAYLISAVSSTMAMANAAVPLLLSCALLFCGFILRMGSMPSYYLWVLKANVFHYSWGALMVNQYDQHRNALLGRRVRDEG
jgi:ABC-type multidrug transport system permease subunit